jgi:hypothetical protein
MILTLNLLNFYLEQSFQGYQVRKIELPTAYSLVRLHESVGWPDYSILITKANRLVSAC